MTMTTQPAARPSFLARILGGLDPRATARVLSVNQETGALEGHGVDLLGQARSSALSRRLERTNAQVVASTAAVFAAVRFREQAITRPDLVLQQAVGGEWRDIGTLREPSAHPVLMAMRRINAATTTKQGIGGIERGKLTNGDHFWVKRRDGLGTVREFEVWDGATSWAVPREDRPWEPAFFAHYEPATGKTITVAPADAIWFRHIVDPTNPMRSLTPIGSIRVATDTAHEAMRANQRYFDQGIGVGGVLMPKEGTGGLGPAEVERLREEINSEWKGTDNQHRWHFVEETLAMLATPQSNRDLEYAAILEWGVVEVSRAFEVSPITLKDFSHATYTNADQAGAQDWETVRNQLDATVEEINEFFIRPDVGDDFRLEPRYTGIGALADSLLAAAEVDEVRLKSAMTTVNLLRKRDGQPPVPWGDVPIVPSNMVPLGTVGAPGSSMPADGGGDGGRMLRAMLALVDRARAEGWTDRQLKNEVRALARAEARR